MVRLQDSPDVVQMHMVRNALLNATNIKLITGELQSMMVSSAFIIIIALGPTNIPLHGGSFQSRPLGGPATAVLLNPPPASTLHPNLRSHI